MLVLTRRESEVLFVGQNVAITVLGIKGNQVRIGIAAPRDVNVARAELLSPTERTTREEATQGGRTPAPRLELTNGQIAQLADFAGVPVTGTPLEDQDVLVIQHADAGHSGPGLYARYDELPEEGAIYLDGQLQDSPKGGSDALREAAIRARRCLAWACEQRPEFNAEYQALDAALLATSTEARA